mmetsp:Transcript_5712/g.15709  ORF Transcript_5712/g.15709 Transcript_5712/m.15709 type:complete len:847 (+) Transcript_5712:128-2668(+)|eukprot:CAMPEP_0115394878 /NCGR_PEP_ID=MMETSP0271-20121206/12495_1 /TAXON_ID=71861 /ORGANISM="Scrippsiella trochoidea, Strain CCMP3099" /LENGTH=846 /DNA_ID=CAMNT_0002818567 /DNA_START=48 /DNA_END=2588 /DNA_ORIENTATION=+
MGQGSGTLSAQLEERYFLQKVKLGQGSFGTVWRAIDRKDNITVAIKQLDKNSLPSRGVRREDIDREIKMMKACQHENITKLYETFEDATSIYLALEYCDGGDFGDKVKERGMAATEGEVAEWMRQMCASIQAMHSRGICHRDVKPDNFMVQGYSTLKLSDFGLAIYPPRGSLLQEKCGTPAFMSPEQHRLPKWSAGYSFPADIWAVGVSMYMMMFGGKHPFLNDRGSLDEGALLSGELDFRDTTNNKLGFFGFAGLGGASLRFSEEARSLCKRMVEPDPNRRMTADDTVNFRWLQSGRAAAAAEAAAAGQAGAAAKDGVSNGGGSRSATPPQVTAEPEQPLKQKGGRSSTPRNTPPAGSREVMAEKGAVLDAPGGRGDLRARTPPAPKAQARGYSPKGRSATPGPEGRKAMEQAAKLEAANQALMSELEERKRREEELMREQKRLEIKQKIFEKQKTKELEELEKQKTQQERELQAVQAQLEKQHTKPMPDSAARGSASGSASSVAVIGGVSAPSRSRPADRTAMPDKGLGSGSLLKDGSKCRYESGTYGWIPAVIKGYNESDGTYNLDVKPHAPSDKIAPTGEVSAAEAWPAGTLAFYLSSSASRWLPAVVVSFNESDGTYNLDVRDHADIDRIRARTDKSSKPGDEAMAEKMSDRQSEQRRTPLGGGGVQSKVTSLDSAPLGTSPPPSASSQRGRGRLSDSSAHDGAPEASPDMGDRTTTGLNRISTPAYTGAASSPSAPPRWVNKGDVCYIRDHGLVFIESSVGRDGCYTVKVNDKLRLQKSAEEMRAPREAKFAWPPGTKVSYLSASVGKWIDAQVVSFNNLSGTYNLDVRPEADPDKVRPR